MIHGAAVSGNTALYGGAVYVDSGTVDMSDGVVSDNTAEYGGAIYLTGGNMVVNGGTLRDNEAVTQRRCDLCRYGYGADHGRQHEKQQR